VVCQVEWSKFIQQKHFTKHPIQFKSQIQQASMTKILQPKKGKSTQQKQFTTHQIQLKSQRQQASMTKNITAK